MMRLLILFFLLWSTINGAPAAEIYRCERDGVIEFSDQPCQDEDPPYRPTASFSVIPPADDLETIQQQNRDWMNAYRIRQAEAERARSNQAPALTRNAASPPAQAAPVRPWLWPVYPQRRPGFRPSPDRPIPRREQPYSALSGPFPGTRPRPAPADTRDDGSSELRR